MNERYSLSRKLPKPLDKAQSHSPRKLVLTIMLSLAVCGCATYQEKRALLLAPAPLNSPANKTVIDGMYASSLRAAQTDPSAIPAMIDAGIARNSLNCSDWLERVSVGKRNTVMTDHELGVTASLVQTLEGIAKASSAVVAVTGALGVAAQGVLRNVQTDLLLAPSQYNVQATLKGILGSCHAQLRDAAPGMTFGQAFVALDECGRVCSFETAQAAANNALTTTETVVQPVSGALMTRPR